MDIRYQFQKFCQIEKWKWLLVVSVMAITHIFCQSMMLPYGKALVSLFPEGDTSIHEKVHVSSAIPLTVGEELFTEKVPNFVDAGLLSLSGKDTGDTNVGEEALNYEEKKKAKEDERILDGRNPDDSVDFVDDTGDNDMPFEEHVGEGVLLKKSADTRNALSLEQVIRASNSSRSDDMLKKNRSVTHDEAIAKGGFIKNSYGVGTRESTSGKNYLRNNSSRIGTLANSALRISSGVSKPIVVSDGRNTELVQHDLANSDNGSALTGKPVKKQMRCNMPPKTVTEIKEMERLLVRHHARSRAMKPRWSSERDKEIHTAKFQIENAPLIKTDNELYAPLFRNLSMFKRSYEIMERTLKVYVYRDGEKPIFHQPILKGLYASEGWFMKLMEANKQFTVKDPHRAHLYYMPFSTRMLEHTLYVRNSHNRTNLRQYLKEYSEKIAAKYRFWNRTGGADHFLVACHDWAPYETRHHMEHCIKALCNADVTVGFKIGRDVSLPETYVRSARNPLRDLGGKPPSQRRILAFYAGGMHGYLRPILLQHWKDKDPDMEIFGPMPPGVASKMNYIQHMKSSKYCICPKGYEVNSPRVVEAIFYECVPVIISDNFVPPFFEVLNWKAFSIILAEKDIPNLKDILLSVSDERYLELQLGVRKVQKHFLWHPKPLKYDLFHMTLHSIWYNRAFQIKPR
ncbi:hypothetical protein Leryth_024020 [Lithospermum erythrorhizon]|nr:hypothetical protein Leryth_024020 [Lithospermum erythrorhizon]